MTAIGGSEDAARLMGLPIARVKTTMYTVSGLLAGLAGLLVAARPRQVSPPSVSDSNSRRSRRS